MSKAFIDMSEGCFKEALSLFIVVFKETVCKTCCVESRVDNVIKGAKIFPTGWPFYGCKKGV